MAYRQAIFGRGLTHLIGYYKLDGDFNDSVSPVADVLLGGSTGYLFSNGKFGQSLFRDNTMGSSTKYAENNISKYSFTNGTSDVAYSFTFWIKTIGVGSSYGFLVGKNSIGLGNQNTNAEYLISLTTAHKLSFQKWSNGSTTNWDRFITINSVPLEEWVHIAVTDDSAGSVKLYINGILQSANKTTGGTGFVKYSETYSSKFGIISSPAANPITYFYGSLDELAIFKNRVLTSNDIHNIINRNLPIR